LVLKTVSCKSIISVTIDESTTLSKNGTLHFADHR